MYVTDIRSRTTPIPTPLTVRILGSLGVGGSIAAMVSQAAPGAKIAAALICVAIALGITLAHPYRKEMRAFAEEKRVDRAPSLSMLVPLMAWWFLLMLAPLAQWPAVGAVLAGAIAAVVAWVLFPHIDGSRRLVYA